MSQRQGNVSADSNCNWLSKARHCCCHATRPIHSILRPDQVPPSQATTRCPRRQPQLALNCRCRLQCQCDATGFRTIGYPTGATVAPCYRWLVQHCAVAQCILFELSFGSKSSKDITVLQLCISTTPQPPTRPPSITSRSRTQQKISNYPCPPALPLHSMLGHRTSVVRVTTPTQDMVEPLATQHDSEGP